MNMTEYSGEMNTAGVAALSTGYMVTMLAICVVGIIAMWKMFTKAGEAGWKSIVPILNIYTLFKISWANVSAGLMTLLCFVPFVNCVIVLILNWKTCKAFGKGVGFFIADLFFSPITDCIIAFGSAQYEGPQ